MDDFNHLPTPDADQLKQMFEADGGVAARSIDDLHEAAAREALLTQQRRAQSAVPNPDAPEAGDLASQSQVMAEQREAARDQINQIDQAASTAAEHLQDVRLRRDITAPAEPADAREHVGSHRPGPVEANGAVGIAAAGAAAPKDRDEVLRSIFKKQLPSAWKPEAKQPAKEPLHRRAARFIISQFKRGRHVR